ncbi:MAG: bifunctional folylpolyglutamate synthase/dihydrofolate synthase [Candidatus Polarisedimenticolia bacterium]
MDYQATLSYLDRVQEHGIKLELRTIRALLAALGNPQQAYPSIAVAGTNGKGSVCAFLASVLRAAGVRAGLYTSPHLVGYEERIIVDGRLISSGEFAEVLTVVRERIDGALPAGGLPAHPTHFEILTAAALEHFRRARVDAAVLEVGLGGRLDAVAAAGARLAVITHVGLEHTQILGSTLEAIAGEKAGVVGEACRVVVTGETHPGALASIREAAAARGARLIEAAGPGQEAGMSVGLAGAHQRRNALVAALAAEALHEAGVVTSPIPRAAIASGLASVRWPGRLQVVARDPLVVLDGAHNPDGCRALARWLREELEPSRRDRLCLVFGALEDKEIEPMARALFPLAGRIVLTRGRSPRFRDPESLRGFARESGAEVAVLGEVSQALDDARAWAGARGAVCLCGSLYLVGDALAALGLDPYGSMTSVSPSSQR